MNERPFRAVVTAIALGFTALFSAVFVPPVSDNPDILGAFGARF